MFIGIAFVSTCETMRAHMPNNAKDGNGIRFVPVTRKLTDKMLRK